MCLLAADTAITGAEQFWTQDDCNGVRLRATWAAIEPSEGNFQWAWYDAAVSAALANKKQLGISIVSGDQSNCPVWVTNLGAQVITLSTGACLLPWDPICLAKWLNVVAAFGARYSASLTYVPMGGYSRELTTAFIESATDIPLIDSLGGLASWRTCFNTVRDAYHAAFSDPSIIIVSDGAPYPNDAGAMALQSAVNDSLALYNLMGPQTTSLNSDTSGGSLPYQLLKTYFASRPTGSQFVTNTHGFGGLTLHGTPLQVIERGVVLDAHFIEAYEVDVDNALYHDQFKTGNALMVAY